jgi:hypothetical protein
MEQKRTAYRSLMERGCLQNLVIDWRINLKLIFKNGMGVVWPKKGISGALL